MKKRILSLILTALLLVSALCLTSCEVGSKVDSINGVAIAEAFATAQKAVKEAPQYKIDVSLDADVEVASISFAKLLELDSVLSYQYNNGNELQTVSPEAVSALKEQGMSGVLSRFDDESRYVDGIFYSKNDDTKIKYAAEESPMKTSEYEGVIKEIVDGSIGETQCYIDDGKYYFTVKIKDASQHKMDMGADKELYRVFFTEDGKIDKIVVECVVETFGLVTITADYSYDNLDPITAPADADTYVEQK